MAAKHSEEFLDVPRLLFKSHVACSLDIGGTLIKAGYTSTNTDGTVRFHFVSYPRDQLDEALTLIRSNCTDFNTPVITCGIGCHQYEKEIQDKLDAKIVNELEMDPTVRGFRFLIKHLGIDKSVYQKETSTQDYADNIMKQCMMLKKQTDEDSSIKMNTDFLSDSKPSQIASVPAEDESVFLVLLGSATAVLMLNPDGSYSMVDNIPRSGLTFLGMGSIMTGAKSYEELIDLAERGDNTKIDTDGHHLKAGSTGQGIYSSMPDDLVYFQFGNAAFKNLDDFSRADIAAALLAGICADTASRLHTRAVIRRTRHVYFAGSLTSNSEVARYYMDREFNLRNAFDDENYQVNHQCLRYGSYLGILGNLIKSLELLETP